MFRKRVWKTIVLRAVIVIGSVTVLGIAYANICPSTSSLDIQGDDVDEDKPGINVKALQDGDVHKADINVKVPQDGNNKTGQNKTETRADAQIVRNGPEPQYVTTFRKETASKYESLLSYDDNGNVLQVKDGTWRNRPGATEGLVKSAPELFEKIPLQFLDNFKNPCWLRNDTELNCLPYFYVIGMYKCGTTDMWDKIIHHPDVLTGVPKEPHWWGPRRNGFTSKPIHWDEVTYIRNITGGNDDRSLEWYLNFYKAYAVPKIISDTITTKDGGTYHPKIFGDSSISTVYTLGLDWTRNYPDAKEPPFTNADLIRALQPKAKIILLIRNPTQRADSWYWYLHRTDAEAWDKKAKQFIDCYNQCFKNFPLRYCAYAGGCPYQMIPDLQVGIYHVYLRDWLNAFSRDGVLVIRLEDWKAEPAKTFSNVLEFLELRLLSKEEEEAIFKRASSNVNKRDHAQTLNETWKALDDFYRPHHEPLAYLMGDKKYLYS